MKSCTFVLVLGALCAAENVLQTKPGQTQTLICGIGDSSATFKWMRGSDLLHSKDPRTGMPLRGKVELVKRSHLKNEKNLQISKITREDAGLFTCSANGQQEHHRLVVSSASVRPPGRLEVGSAVTLQCDVSGLPQGAAVDWVGPGGARRERTTRLQLTAVTLEDAGPWECVFSADGQTMRETITLQVTEPRPETTAAPSTTWTTEGSVATSPDYDVSPTPGPLELLGLSWWVWAAVGGGCLVFLLWVLILVMCIQMKRRKRRFRKMKAAHLRPSLYCQCPGGPTAVAGRRGMKT